MSKNLVNWNKRLIFYKKSDVIKSISQVSLTFSLFVLCISFSYLIYKTLFILYLPFSVLSGFFLIKLFSIQHDCSHHSFFNSRLACEWLGRCISVFTLTPFNFWRMDHDQHHASVGNLNERGTGDITTLTVKEYNNLRIIKKICYRIYRNPFFMFLVGPTWLFMFRYRFPVNLGHSSKLKSINSILLNDVMIFFIFSVLVYLIGLEAFLFVWLPCFVISSTVGVWLFYVQHQYEETYWEVNEKWSFVDAAIHGSSFYRLPTWLNWITGWLGHHHIHHLSSRIPNYNLARVYADIPELRLPNSIGFIGSFSCTKLALWCEERKKMVSFRNAL
jgi:omega-6 fatty acid desaturase (delta-12 desaturase)